MEDAVKKERKFKKCIFPFIMTIITFLIGCFFGSLCLGRPFSIVAVIEFFISFLPCINFLTITLVCYFSCNTQKSKIIINVITAFFTLALMEYYVIAIFICAFMEVLNPVTDVRYYTKHINRGDLEVFPEEIPDNVEDVEFIYAPGVLQGGTEMALYYVDKNMTIEEFDNKYKDKAEWVGHINEYNIKRGLLSGAFSNTPAYDNNEEDYIIYLVKSRCDDSGYCNHGNFLLAAFNEKTNEVIFKEEGW